MKMIMEEMTGEGFGFYLDDFGTGYSNISCALSLPFEYIKLDRSLLVRLPGDSKVQVFVRSMVETFHAMGQKIVAEGVEEEEQIELLRQFGVDCVQGYYYGKPMPEDEFRAAVAKGWEGTTKMREIAAATITEAIRDMCIEANYGLAPDMRKVFEKAVEEEESPLGRQVLGQLKENLKIAGEDKIPICQDTGMAVVFMKIGQDVHITGGRLADAVNEGVRQGYEQGYLRKSVVGDPIERINTKDNTPAVIHCEITDGEQIDITVAPKGFGSENMSRVFMLKPADGLEGVKKSILQAVREAGPNACPPWWWGGHRRDL